MSVLSILKKPFPYRQWNAAFILIVINVGVFMINLLIPRIFNIFILFPADVVSQGFFWQPFTYMFMHADYSHLFFNMFGLFMFGLTLEQRLGSIEFLLLYLLTGLLVGLTGMFTNGGLLGASGALFAVMAVYAVFFSQTTIMVFFVLPMKAPMAVLFFAVASIFFGMTGIFSNVAHFAHLAGIIFGLLYCMIRFSINPIRVFLNNR